MSGIANGGVMRKKLLWFFDLLLAAVAVMVLSPHALQAATIVAYVEAPTLQSSSVPGVVTETFDSFTPGIYTTPLTTNIGTYQDTSPASKFAIDSANIYGGAGGTGNYFAVGAESGSTGPVLVNLNMQANYFGFWWSAGDPYNVVSFEQNGVTLASFATSDIVSFLPEKSGATVTAINGQTYNTLAYYANPNSNFSGQDPNEAFAYVDIIANGFTFDQIAFTNANLGTGFESDNHSIAVGVTDPPSGDVIVENVPLAVPEPGSLVLLGLGVGFIAFSQVKRISRA